MFVGMDVHKESIDISLAEEGRDGEVRRYGVIPGDLEAVAKMVRALRAPNRRLRFVYEAGPCGFGIHRYLTGQGEDCVVVNPSSMPKRSGDRIKTDRRDGDALARLHGAGELTAIDIPTPDDEALRDLVRAREDAVGLSTQAKHRLKAFLLRQGRRYPGRAGWTHPYRRWLADLSFPLARSTSPCRSTATRLRRPNAASNGSPTSSGSTRRRGAGRPWWTRCKHYVVSHS
jgi:transposase